MLCGLWFIIFVKKSTFKNMCCDGLYCRAWPLGAASAMIFLWLLGNLGVYFVGVRKPQQLTLWLWEIDSLWASVSSGRIWTRWALRPWQLKFHGSTIDYYFVAVKTEYQRELSSNSRYDISFTLWLRTSQLLSLVLSLLNCEMRWS